jgi:hypothetical protein
MAGAPFVEGSFLDRWGVVQKKSFAGLHIPQQVYPRRKYTEYGLP